MMTVLVPHDKKSQFKHFGDLAIQQRRPEIFTLNQSVWLKVDLLVLQSHSIVQDMINTRPYQLYWDDKKMGTTTSSKKKQSGGWPYQYNWGTSITKVVSLHSFSTKIIFVTNTLTIYVLLRKIVQVQLRNVEIAGHLGQKCCVVSCYLPRYKRHK